MFRKSAACPDNSNQSNHSRVRAAQLGCHSWASYLTGAIVGLAGICVPVLAINCVVDPLWHFRGNLITGENYAFNERRARLNLFLRNTEQYDCILFGSSRVTLVDPSQFQTHHCFNMSFSGGGVREFREYAAYLRNLGFDPEVVYVGVDASNFQAGEPWSEAPAYVLANEAPPGWLKDYLSWDALALSLRTLQGLSPMPRYYDENFVGAVLEHEPYQPPAKIVPPRQAYSVEKADLYLGLQDIFPNSNFIGYVPPISAWEAAEIPAGGNLEAYLKAIYRISASYDAMYDFSIPSEWTTRTDNTYDGSHYYVSANTEIVRILEGAPIEFGVRVDQMSFSDYAFSWRESLADFLD